MWGGVFKKKKFDKIFKDDNLLCTKKITIY